MDAALAKLDPIDAGLVSLVDIEGAPFSRAIVELDLPSGEAGEHLAPRPVRGPRRARPAPPELTARRYASAVANTGDQSR